MRLSNKVVGTIIGNYKNTIHMKRIRIKSVEMAREYMESFELEYSDLPKEADRIPHQLKTRNEAEKALMHLISLYSNLIYLLHRNALYENPGVLVLLTMYMNEEIRRINMDLMNMDDGSLKELNPDIEDIDLVFYNHIFLKSFIKLERFIELMNNIDRNGLYCLKDEKRCINDFISKYR